jgi:hypothetical protein
LLDAFKKSKTKVRYECIYFFFLGHHDSLKTVISGLDTEGIFRKSGSTAAVNQLQLQFEEQSNPFLIKFPSTLSTHSLAGLFKRYLQQLPEPVIPRHYQSMFLSVFGNKKKMTCLCVVYITCILFRV